MMEIRCPVVVARCVGDADISRTPSLEYFVLDYDESRNRIIHPTTGRNVDAGVYFKERWRWNDWLRGITDKP